MEPKDWINVLAIVLSPVIAVSVTLWYQKRADKISVKEDIFFILMENRGTPIIPVETVQALNSIYIVFHGNEKIINLWSTYFDSLSPVSHDPAKSYRLYVELLSAIAIHLGYKKLTQMQIDKVYTPQMHIDLVENYQKMSDEFSRVLKNTDSFGSNQKPGNRTSSRTRAVKKTV